MWGIGDSPGELEPEAETLIHSSPTIYFSDRQLDRQNDRTIYPYHIYTVYIYILPKYELPHLWPYFSPRIHGSFMFNNVHTSTSQKWLASSVMSTSSTSKNTDLPDFGFSRWCRDHVVFYDAALPNGAWQHATCHPRHDTATRRHGDMTPSSKKIYRIFSPPLSRKK